LYDAILIKENHIAACGGIASAVAQARAQSPRLPLEVEVENLDELRAALAAGVARIMLDDFSDADMLEAVAIARDRARLEVSGGVSLDRVRAIAQTGVHYISIGALTKHVRALDLSLRLLD
jgi:nicotinate-nucleotide pyrophosphorylase (carboxylating)